MDHSFRALEAWTAAYTEPDYEPPSSPSPTLGGDRCSPTGSPESLSTTTSETWVYTENEGLPSTDICQTLQVAGANAGGGFGGRPLIFSAVASPVRTSVSPDAAQDSKPENAAPSSSSSCGSQMSLFSPAAGSSLRTFPDFFPAKTDEISPSFSRRWPTSGFTTSPGECWTADTSECPSGGGVSSSLADVLEADVPAKYFLSPRAAAGILRRAEKRGRMLPAHLAAALEAVAGRRTPNE